MNDLAAVPRLSSIALEPALDAVRTWSGSLAVRWLTALLVSIATPALAAASPWQLVFEVDTNDDAVDAQPGDGLCATSLGTCSLRAAVMESNSRPAPSTIVLPEGELVFRLTAHGEGPLGDLDVAGEVTIAGDGVRRTIVDGDGADRVFDVGPTGRLALRDLTVRNGRSVELSGGGIRALGGLELQRVSVRENLIDAGGGSGGGVFAEALLGISDSEIMENSCGWGFCDGGGLYYFGALEARIVRSTIARNRATGNGGGLVLDGPATLVNTTVAQNETGVSGGGLDCRSGLALFSVTIAANRADALDAGLGTGGGIHQGGQYCNPWLQNSLIAGNLGVAGADDCDARLSSVGFNLIESASGCTVEEVPGTGDRIGVTPGPMAFGDHGGATWTVALDAASAAVNAGNPAGCFDDLQPLTTDQRGPAFVRAAFSRCDIGAFELQPDLFADGFEAGGPQAWTSTVGFEAN